MRECMKTKLLFFIFFLYTGILCAQSHQEIELYYDDGQSTRPLKFLWNASTYFTTRFTPPTFPVEVVEVKYYLADTTGDNSFDLMFYAETGENLPGTIIRDKSPISGGRLGWNSIDLRDNPLIVDNDFYVCLVYNGTQITLGAEDTPPLAHRTFDTDC